MCSMRIKLNYQGMETLFTELAPPEKKAIHLLVSGSDKGNKINKLTAELVSIIAFLCKKLNWTEDIQDEDENFIGKVNKEEPKEGIVTYKTMTDDEDYKNYNSKTPYTGNDTNQKSINNGYPFRCLQCDKNYCSALTLRRHERIHTGDLFSCSQCDKKFTRAYNLKKHEKMHMIRGVNKEESKKDIVTYRTLTDDADDQEYENYTSTNPDIGVCSDPFNVLQHENTSVTKAAGEDAMKENCLEPDIENEEKSDSDAAGQEKMEEIQIEGAEQSVIEPLTSSALPFSCSYCDKKFRIKSKLKRHEMTHTAENPQKNVNNGYPFRCLLCDKNFSSAWTLRSHERIHTGDLFSCNQCDKKFTRADHLKRHEKMHMISGIHKEESKEDIVTYRTLTDDADDQEYENYTSTNPDIGIYSDPFDVFQDENTSVTKAAAENTMKESCLEPDTEIEEKSDSNAADQEKMEQIHIEEAEQSVIDPLTNSALPFSCSYCGKEFRIKSKLKRHELTHTAENPQKNINNGYPFRCLQCDKNFSSAGALRRHERIHTGDLFSCNQCDKKFTRAYNLKKHEKLHT